MNAPAGLAGKTKPACEFNRPCDLSSARDCCNVPMWGGKQLRACDCRACHPRRDRAHEWYRDDDTHAHCTKCPATISVKLGLYTEVPRAVWKRTGSAKCGGRK